MSTLEIHDEELARKLRQIAEREHRPVEDVLKSMVERYPAEIRDETPKADQSEAVRRVRRKAYVKARAYWESVGDMEKAALTDEELDEQFRVFDEEGIPRLKSEIPSWEPPVGSLAYAAKMAREADIRTENPIDASLADDILNDEFADYLLKRTKRKNADAENSG
jgi:hypothetical protein